MLKEKTKWYYMGEDLTNSFEFYLSKIKDDSCIIITNKGTSEMNVHKVNYKHLQTMIEKKRLKNLKD